MSQFIEGFLLQASLVFAFGAQNIFVLESGLKKRRAYLVATACTLCDVVLIGIGVMGAASIFIQVPLLKVIFGVLGVSFLFLYGCRKLLEAYKGASQSPGKAETASSVKQVLILALGFSLLNPHVYLDTVILVGGYSAKFPELLSRIFFGAGASATSVLWFFGLTTFASSLSRVLNNPQSMRKVALFSGIILIVLSCKLGQDVLGWILPIK